MGLPSSLCSAQTKTSLDKNTTKGAMFACNCCAASIHAMLDERSHLPPPLPFSPPRSWVLDAIFCAVFSLPGFDVCRPRGTAHVHVDHCIKHGIHACTDSV